MGKEENFGDKRNTEGFDKHPELINKKGRPLKVYTQIKKMGYSADDLKAAFQDAAWYDTKALKKIYEDETKPIILRILANQFYQALKKGDWNKIRDILEHTIGKPQQSLNVNMDLPPIIFQDATGEPIPEP